MKNPKKSYLVSADGWPMKYIRADTVAQARSDWRAKTGGPAGAKVVQVLGRKQKTKGGE